MANNSYDGLSKTEEMSKKFKIIGLVVAIFLAVTYFIGGICLCVLVDVQTGVTMLFSGLIIGALGIFGVYFLHQLLMVQCDAMRDIKAARIANDEREISGDTSSQNVVVQKAYETSELYYLLYLERGAYLYVDVENPGALKTTRSLLSAMKFQSEEEALKYADYKGLNMEEKWKIVKKSLIVAVE